MAAISRATSVRAVGVLVLAGIGALVLALAFALAGCSSQGGPDASAAESSGETAGPAYEMPAEPVLSPYRAESLQGTPQAGVDVSGASSGYVCAVAQGESRFKLQIVNGDASYNYDLPSDGTPTAYPLNMGDGTYTFRIMQNTAEDRYVELFSTTADVVLDSEFEPFLRPNFFCSYDAESACVKKAQELAADAVNQGDVVRAVYDYLVDNVVYDADKAAGLSGASGYVPDPDETLAAGSGICFDYASLAAAMLRSLGVPCQIVTGYVSPEGIYHAWNMVWIDGSWHSVEVSVDPDEWTRIDTTFAASGAGATVGDGSAYTDRYVY